MAQISAASRPSPADTLLFIDDSNHQDGRIFWS